MRTVLVWPRAVRAAALTCLAVSLSLGIFFCPHSFPFLHSLPSQRLHTPQMTALGRGSWRKRHHQPQGKSNAGHREMQQSSARQWPPGPASPAWLLYLETPIAALQPCPTLPHPRFPERRPIYLCLPAPTPNLFTLLPWPRHCLVLPWGMLCSAFHWDSAERCLLQEVFLDCPGCLGFASVSLLSQAGRLAAFSSFSVVTVCLQFSSEGTWKIRGPGILCSVLTNDN